MFPTPRSRLLIQQRALDGGLAPVEKGSEAIEIDLQRFDASGVEVGVLGDAQTAEAARIDETQFATGRQS